MKSPKGRTVEGETGAMQPEYQGRALKCPKPELIRHDFNVADTSRAKRKEEDVHEQGAKERRNRYLDYTLEESTELPAPLPLAPAAPIHQQPRGPGAYPHRGVDYQGSHGFVSLDFDEDDVLPTTQEEKLEEGLVTARPVTLLPTETAEPMPLPNPEEKEKEVATKRVNLHIYIPLGLCALLLIIVGISIAVSSAAGRSNPQADSIQEENNSTSSIAATEPPTEWKWDLPVDIPNSTISIIRADPDGSTPQSKAYQWMKADPFLHDYSSERLSQRFAMATFYYATNGGNWTYQGGEEIVPVAVFSGKSNNPIQVFNVTDSKPWLSYEHSECEWLSTAEPKTEATACNNSQETLDHLVVSRNNLQGSLTNELGDMLPSLKALVLGRNSIGGTIPSSIGRLTNLEELAVHRNSFSGSIPTQVGNLSKLWRFSVLESQLTGSIPSEIWQIPGLLDLKLSGNKALGGSLPSDIGVSMPKLKIFQSARNQMSGSLPSSIGLMKDLGSIAIHDNRMTGRLPSELGLADKLAKFYGPNNLFSGTLPAAWSRSLRFVNLQGNSGLTGTVPVEWAAMEVLKLEGTSVSGTIAEELCAMRKLSFDCSPTLCGCDCPCLNATGGP